MVVEQSACGAPSSSTATAVLEGKLSVGKHTTIAVMEHDEGDDRQAPKLPPTAARNSCVFKVPSAATLRICRQVDAHDCAGIGMC